MFSIQKVTIIGANGIMGSNIAGIFASFGAAKVFLVSRTLKKSLDSKNRAYNSVRAEGIKDNLFPFDFSCLEECIAQSDLIFEACKEDWEVKKQIHIQIAEVLDNIKSEDKIICSGTSGLPITKLAELYSKKYRGNVIGMHFFNPPYSMTLCEMIPTEYTNRMIFEKLKEYTTKILFRTVVEVKDSPAFLGNRIGFQFINEALQMAEKYKYNGGIDYIDSILGQFTGRSMAPLVTADFVGLDVHKAIVENIYNNTNDYAHKSFVLPEFVKNLILKGKLGRKTQEGLYKTVVYDSGKKIYQVYDIEHDIYRERIKYTFPFVEEMIAELRTSNYENAFNILIDNESIEAKICCKMLLNYIAYSLLVAREVGDNIYAADDVMATGFNWCPPLALVKFFGGNKHFRKLYNERVDPQNLKLLDLDNLLENIGKSKYDYRSFLRAKS